MQPHFWLGRIFGVSIGLHASWFLIAFLITLAAVQRWWVLHPQWGGGVIWTAAVVTALLFFAGLLAHELSHALVAKARGIPVESITLFALGGVAQIRKDTGDPKTEFFMGIVGPAVSISIGLGCLSLARTFAGPYPTPAGEMLAWLGYLNLVLGVFNLIPGFPLDGGRILRSALWGITKDRTGATRTAARVGQIFGGMLVVFGILNAFTGLGFGGLWLVLIGWFLFEAAKASELQVTVAATLRNVRVGDAMTRECEAVDPEESVQKFVEGRLLRTGHRCFVVKEGQEVAGMVMPKDLKQLDRTQWARTPVKAVMRPLERLRTVTPEMPITSALETMQQDDLNQLPVVERGEFVGLIGRPQVLQLLEARASLSM